MLPKTETGITKQKGKTMSTRTSHKNSYRKGGTYYNIFSYWKKKQVVTKRELIEAGFPATAIRVIVCSPRKNSERGDCRGNYSCHGHRYYAELPKRKTINGVKEEQKYRLRWRKVELEPRKRIPKISIKSKKVEVTSVESEESIKESTAKESTF